MNYELCPVDSRDAFSVPCTSGYIGATPLMNIPIDCVTMLHAPPEPVRATPPSISRLSYTTHVSMPPGKLDINHPSDDIGLEPLRVS